jgi:hypothetical protein
MRDRRYSLVVHRFRPDWLRVDALGASFFCDAVTPPVGVLRFTNDPPLPAVQSLLYRLPQIAVIVQRATMITAFHDHRRRVSLPRNRGDETLARQFSPAQYRHRTAEASKFRHRRVVGELDVRAVHRYSSWPIRRCAPQVGLATAGPPVRCPSFLPRTAIARPPCSRVERSYLRAVERTHRTQGCLRIELPIRKTGLS